MANVGLLGSGTVKNNFSYGGTLRKQGFEEAKKAKVEKVKA